MIIIHIELLFRPAYFSMTYTIQSSKARDAGRRSCWITILHTHLHLRKRSVSRTKGASCAFLLHRLLYTLISPTDIDNRETDVNIKLLYV